MLLNALPMLFGQREGRAAYKFLLQQFLKFLWCTSTGMTKLLKNRPVK